MRGFNPLIQLIKKWSQRILIRVLVLLIALCSGSNLVAQEVGVKKLALTHLFPSIPANDQAEALFIRGMSDLYDGPIIVGRDGTEVIP